MNKYTYTTDGTEWMIDVDKVIISREIFCGYDGCGEEGPVTMSANVLIEMLEGLGYDLSEVELK